MGENYSYRKLQYSSFSATHIVNILSRARLLFYCYCKYFRSSFSCL